MSVIIKDMYIPGRCKDCRFANYVNLCVYICMANSKIIEDVEHSPDDCPLVELPEKHGRLIDVDELIEFIENRYNVTWKDDYEGGIKDACTDILEKISDIPIVIEAEE